MDLVSILDSSNSDKKWRQPTSSHFSKRTKIFHTCSNWDNLPLELVLCIFKHLTLKDCARASMVCHAWNEAFHQPDLWRSFEFTLSQSRRSHMQPTPRGLIEYVLKNHSQSLQFVVLKIDSSRESAESACQILSQLVNCSLKTLGLISSAKPSFKQIDAETFVSALTVVFDSSRSLSSVAIDDTPVDDPSLQLLLSNNSNTLELLKMKSCPKVSPEGILALADNCRCLRELSLNYSLLSDELLLSLSSEAHVRLEHLRIDVCSDEDLLFQKISARSWQTLTSHSPKLTLVMYFFYIREEIFDQFFQTEIPVTHLYFVDYVPKLVLERIGKHCPRLTELVVGANGNAQIDSEMLLIAHNCRQLTSLGLGECEVSCSAFVEFTRICGPRLKDLSVMEEALTEDEQYDLNGACTEVSRYIGREWMPEVMPTW